MNRCNCENGSCAHTPGPCLKPAVGHTVMYLGNVCPDCFCAYPPVYQKNNPDNQPTTPNRGN